VALWVREASRVQLSRNWGVGGPVHRRPLCHRHPLNRRVKPTLQRLLAQLRRLGPVQPAPARSAHTHSTTVVVPIPQQSATWRWLRPQIHSNRNISRIFLTFTLRAGISLPSSMETSMPEVRSRRCCHRASRSRFRSKATTLPGKAPILPGQGPKMVAFRLEWVVALPSESVVALRPETVVAFDRNTHPPPLRLLPAGATQLPGGIRTH
jgi:hypothetical protein